jgi:flagellar biosynthetic protein FliR
MAFDPMSFNTNSVFGKLYQMLAMMLLFATDAHLLVIGGLLETFDRMPVGSLWQAGDVTQVVTVAFGVFFVSAVQIALPLIGVLFLADLGLALLTKVAPMLNAIGIMFPAKIGLTLLVVGLSFPVLPHVIDRLVEAASEAMAAIG